MVFFFFCEREFMAMDGSNCWSINYFPLYIQNGFHHILWQNKAFTHTIAREIHDCSACDTCSIIFSRLLSNALPVVSLKRSLEWEPFFQIISGIISLGGVYLAYLLFLKKISFAQKLYSEPIASFFFKGWGFDKLYDLLFVKPYVWIATINKSDFMDYFNQSLAWLTIFFNRSLSLTQNGRLRYYIIALTIGIAVILTYMMH